VSNGKGFHLTRSSEVTLPSPDAEVRIAIPMPEFTEVKEWIEGMTDPVVHATNFAFGFFGIAVGSFVAWLQMDHDKLSGRTVLLIAIGALILTGFMAWVDHQLRSRGATDRKRICNTMDRFEKTCPRLSPSGDIEDPPDGST